MMIEFFDAEDNKILLFNHKINQIQLLYFISYNMIRYFCHQSRKVNQKSKEDSKLIFVNIWSFFIIIELGTEFLNICIILTLFYVSEQ
jgi:hypothetical protein